MSAAAALAPKWTQRSFSATALLASPPPPPPAPAAAASPAHRCAGSRPGGKPWVRLLRGAVVGTEALWGFRILEGSRRSSQPRKLSSRAAMAPTTKIQPTEGQESVWDYPRPPRLERTAKHIQIIFNGELVADTREAYRVLETSHPPVYYIPQKDIRMQYVRKSPGTSFCEWKGSATYWSVQVGDKSAPKVGWSYENPSPNFVPMKSYIAFYCAPMDKCTIDGELVEPQPGGFYGGWITKDVVGPFKGSAGTWGW